MLSASHWNPNTWLLLWVIFCKLPLVFNALSFPRTELVRYDAMFEKRLNNFRILDPRGRPVPFRMLGAGRFKPGERLSMAAVEFLASDVPGMGYRLYRIEPAAGAAETPHWEPAPPGISNRFFTLKLDAATGSIASLVDRRSGRELLNTAPYGGNELVLAEEKQPNAEGVTHFTGTEVRGAGFRPDRILWQQDALGTRLRIEAPFLSGRRVQEIAFYNELSRIDFRTELSGFPGHDGMLAAVFPLRGASQALYETHGAVTARPDGIYDAQSWVDLVVPGGGVALLNRGTGGHQTENGTVRLLLLRSITDFAGYYTPRSSEAGDQVFEYSLYPHPGAWSEAGAGLQAHSFNSPLRALSTDAHSGTLPPEHSFMQVLEGAFEITAFKQAEEGGDLILRGYEDRGQRGRVRLRLAAPLERVWEASLLERAGKELAFRQGEVQIACAPFEFVTLRIRLRR